MRKFFVFIWFLMVILSGCQTNEMDKEETIVNTAQKNVPEYNQSPEDIVDMHGNITNLDKFLSFLEHVKQGNKDIIRVVRYSEEGDPMLHDLEYDGKLIHSTIDTRRDHFGSGGINTATCKFVAVEEEDKITKYSLSGCDQKNRNNVILVIFK